MSVSNASVSPSRMVRTSCRSSGSTASFVGIIKRSSAAIVSQVRALLRKRLGQGLASRHPADAAASRRNPGRQQAAALRVESSPHMRVLVVGQGGREHAICWKLKQSPLVTEIYAAPGNAGIDQVADCVPIGVADIIELADFAEQLKMDLTIVGPELPLTLGIVDEFQKRGLPIFGPTRLAAELEGSKVFSKEFMRKYGIPTAEASACSSVDEAKAALKTFKFPAVIKVDGLASGKGVVIVESKAAAEEYLRLVFEAKKFGHCASLIRGENLMGG